MLAHAETLQHPWISTSYEMIRETRRTASMAVFSELRWQTSEPAGAKAQTLTAMFSAGLKPRPATNLFAGNGKQPLLFYVFLVELIHID